MAVLKCKMCGGDLDITSGAGVAVCEYCGTKQTLPKSDDEKRIQLYDRANHFRRINEFDKAMGVYEMILSDTKDDAEAYWGIVLCRYGITYVEDPQSGRKMPTVNRSQFISVLEDADYKNALKYATDEQKSVFEAQANDIDGIHKKFLKISQNEEPFDVFICYKESDENGERTQDSVYAYDIYSALTKEGLKVFFSRVTLEDKLGSMYEPYIFSALNSAKVMLVIGTKREYFDAVWVKNEWSRFLGLIKEGKEKTVIPVYKDISPYDMPDEFQYLQAQDMGKIGYIQDIVHGVKKLLEKPVKVTKGVAAPQANRIDPEKAVKLGFMALESGKWAEASTHANNAIKVDPDNAQAHLCALMAKNKIKTKEDINSKKNKNKILLDDNKHYKYYCDHYKGSDKIEIDPKRIATKKKLLPIKVASIFGFIFSIIVCIFAAGILFGSNILVILTGEVASICAVISFAVAFAALVDVLKKRKIVSQILMVSLTYLAIIATCVVTLIFASSISYDVFIKDLEQYYEEGEYDTVIGLSTEYDPYIGADSYISNELFRSYQKEEQIKNITFKSFNAKAKEFIDAKDYMGFYDWIVSLGINNGDETLFYDFFANLDVKIPESDYPLVKEALKEIALEHWNINTASMTDYQYDLMTDTISIQYYLAWLIDDDSDESIDIYINVHYYISEMGYTLKETLAEYCFSYDIAQEILLSDDNIYNFLLGTWVSTENSDDYLEFYSNDNGGVSSRYFIPFPDVERDYYEIEDCVMFFSKETGEEDEKVADVFKFTFIDANKMECYCYENGKIYTLRRQ